MQMWDLFTKQKMCILSCLNKSRQYGIRQNGLGNMVFGNLGFGNLVLIRVNVPVVFRMKIKISKSRLSLLKNVNFFSFFCLFVIFDERNVKYYAENIFLIFFVYFQKRETIFQFEIFYSSIN
jgi:hypothetical protein